MNAMDPELEVAPGPYLSASNASNRQDPDPQSTAPALLSANGLFKRHGADFALHNTTFAIEEGEIVAVMGENGAGKSTLSKALAGALCPDTGEIRVAGNVVHFSSPRGALRAGIAYVPQELEYLPALTVAENLLLGQWRGRGPYTTRAEMVRRAGRIAALFRVDIDVRVRMAHLGLAGRQLVEILKGLARQAKVVILDEPTASLTSEESANLFGILTRFTASGVAFIYISHRLDWIFRITDRLPVMHNGRIVADRPTGVTTCQITLAIPASTWPGAHDGCAEFWSTHSATAGKGRSVVGVRQSKGLLGGLLSIGSAVNVAVSAAEKPRPAKKEW